MAHVVRDRFRPDQVNAAALARYETRTGATAGAHSDQHRPAQL